MTRVANDRTRVRIKRDEEHGSSDHIWRSLWRPLGPGRRPPTAVKEELCYGRQVLQELLCWRTGVWQYIFFVISIISGAKASCHIFSLLQYFTVVQGSFSSWHLVSAEQRSVPAAGAALQRCSYFLWCGSPSGWSTTWSSWSSSTSPSGFYRTSSSSPTISSCIVRVIDRLVHDSIIFFIIVCYRTIRDIANSNQHQKQHPVDWQTSVKATAQPNNLHNPGLSSIVFSGLTPTKNDPN